MRTAWRSQRGHRARADPVSAAAYSGLLRSGAIRRSEPPSLKYVVRAHDLGAGGDLLDLLETAQLICASALGSVVTATRSMSSTLSTPRACGARTWTRASGGPCARRPAASASPSSSAAGSGNRRAGQAGPRHRSGSAANGASARFPRLRPRRLTVRSFCRAPPRAGSAASRCRAPRAVGAPALAPSPAASSAGSSPVGTLCAGARPQGSCRCRAAPDLFLQCLADSSELGRPPRACQPPHRHGRLAPVLAAVRYGPGPVTIARGSYRSPFSSEASAIAD